MYVAVDCDGTIVEHMFPDLGPPVPGAVEWMRTWAEAGAKLLLWTVRDDDREVADPRYAKTLSKAVAYCRDNGVEFYGVNENPDQKAWSLSPKVYAHVYVDDAAFGCPLIPGTASARPMVDWARVGPYVLGRITAPR